MIETRVMIRNRSLFIPSRGGGGFVRFCLCHEKIYLIPPLRLCNVLHSPHWQCVGSQFFHSLPFTLRWWRLILPPFSLKTMWSSPPPLPKKKKTSTLPAGNIKWRSSYIVKTVKQVLSFGFKRENLSFQLSNIMM